MIADIRAEEVVTQAAREGDRTAEDAARDAEKRRQAFLSGPVGQAKAAFDRGDLLFQFRFDVESQKKNPLVISMFSDSRNTTGDPNEILNAVANEGWRLVSASFVFREEFSQARDYSVLQSGHKTTVMGTTMGYYVFERRDAAASTTP